ncbi:MAG TPA: VOC family protein [Xanthomonadaceae bacterium]|jgi:catechol 2,3-dioxygenase-like lactoylglutathione lyase family enzyme
MFTLLGIDHVVIRARDLEAMVGFYRDVLGCSVDKRVDRLGLVHLRAGAALIDLIDVHGELGRRGGGAPGPDRRNVDHLCLRIDGFDEAALRAHFHLHGVALDGPHDNYGAEGDGLSFYLDDPEGNTIELKGPARAR